MIFKRKFVLISMGENRILGFFNTKLDAEEHQARLFKTYPNAYLTMRIYGDV